MPNKCSVTGCYTNFNEGTKKTVFKFPGDPGLSKKSVEFLNRRDYEITEYSIICIDNFEERFIIQHQTRAALNYSMNPIPIIHPSFMSLSLAPVPSESRKTPTIRNFNQMNFRPINTNL